MQRRLLFFPPSPLAHYFLLSVEGNGWVAIKQDDATSYGRPAADSGNRPVETAHISFVIMFPLGERWLLHRPFPIFFYFKRALKKKRGEKTRRRGDGRFFFRLRIRARIRQQIPAAGSIGSRNGGTRTQKNWATRGRLTKKVRETSAKTSFVSMSQRKSTLVLLMLRRP